MKPNTVFTLLLLAVTFGGSPLAAEEPTVAEQQEILLEEFRAKYIDKDRQATTVTGLATLPDGKPAVGFKICGWRRLTDNVFFAREVREVRDIFTDENGRFTLSLYYPGSYWFSITDPNDIYTAYDSHFELTESMEPDAIRFQLQKGVPVEGVVIDHDKNEPIAGLPLWLHHDPYHLHPIEERDYQNQLEHENSQQLFREVKTDSQGRFKFVALPGEKYMVSLYPLSLSLEENHSIRINAIYHPYRQPPPSTDVPIYARTFTPDKEAIRLEFMVPTPWQGQLLQKDGTPATGYPVDFEICYLPANLQENRLDIIHTNGGYYRVKSVTDKDGRFLYYLPGELYSLSVRTIDQEQWFDRKYHAKMPSNSVFQLYAPITAKGQLVRKSTGDPLANFVFTSRTSYSSGISTDADGCFEISSLDLDKRVNLCFRNDFSYNPSDPGTIARDKIFYNFTPTEPDKVADLGVLELDESGWLDPDFLADLPGKEIAIEGVTLDGQIFDWKKYSGQVVLINFWAMGYTNDRLIRLYKKFHDKGFEVVGINVNTNLAALETKLKPYDANASERYSNIYQFPWIILADEKRKEAGLITMADRFAINSIPYHILIDRDGKVVSVEARGEKLEAELERLLGK